MVISSTIKRNFFPQEEAPLGPVPESVPEDVQALGYCGTQTPQEASTAEFQNRKTWQYFQCREVQDREGSCLSSFLNSRAHNVASGVPRKWEFGVFNCLGLWRTFAFYFFLVYMVLTVN